MGTSSAGLSGVAQTFRIGVGTVFAGLSTVADPARTAQVRRAVVTRPPWSGAVPALLRSALAPIAVRPAFGLVGVVEVLEPTAGVTEFGRSVMVAHPLGGRPETAAPPYGGVVRRACGSTSSR
ncbi:hypothetical protein C1J01_47200 [Nonomuraea aridisoli]|uniref:Uncharacterized protein n=1 Tax=Nonomuraea aridisoli TaxID=2070368 RepID=A0A2W2ECN6_9ACTN|nr:hypothetical protein C1J01_47200 [Nonomuraea aridisoli]